MQFYCTGGGVGGSENQSVSGVTIICLTQCNTSTSHRVDQVVNCVMLVHSSSMAVWSFWILAGTGTRCHIRRSRASQTCLMGDMSGEYAGHARTGMFSASRNCVRILATWGRALSCWTWDATCDICGIVLCDKTAHFRVAFYCGQPKTHLCNNHAV